MVGRPGDSIVDWSRFQQQLENPVWAVGLGMVAFLAGLAVWYVVWEVWVGLGVIGGHRGTRHARQGESEHRRGQYLRGSLAVHVIAPRMGGGAGQPVGWPAPVQLSGRVSRS